MAVTLVLANLLTPDRFGFFALTYTAILFALGVNRSLAIDPATISAGNSSAVAKVGYFLGALRLWLPLTIVETLLLAAIAALMAPWLFLAAISFPLLAGLEFARYTRLTVGSSFQALLADAVGLSATLLSAAVVLGYGLPFEVFVAGSWALGPILAICIAWPFSVAASTSASVSRKGLGRSLSLDYLAQTGLGHLALAISTPLITVTGVGDLRLAQTLFGATSATFQAVTGIGLTTAVQKSRRGAGTLTRYLRRVALLVLALATANLLAILFLPHKLLAAIVGGRVEAVIDLSPLVFAGLAVQCLTLVPALRARATGRSDVILSARAIAAPWQLLAPIGLARLFGGSGFLAGLALASAVMGWATHFFASRWPRSPDNK